MGAFFSAYVLASQLAGVAVVGYGLFLVVTEARTSGWKTCLALFGIALGGFLIREQFATFGPGDLKMTLESIYLEDFGGWDRLGTGAVAFFDALFQVLPEGDETIVYANLALGAVLPHDLDAELAFIRETLPRLPQDAVIHFADPNESAPCPGHRIEEPLELGLEPPRYLGRAIGRPDLKWTPWPPKPEDEGRPLFYYAMANCLAIPHAKYYDQVPNEIEGPWPNADLMERFRIHQCHCRTALEVVGHRPVVERSLPSRAWSRIRYRRALVPVGFYEILPEDLARIQELRRESPCRRRPCPSP